MNPLFKLNWSGRAGAITTCLVRWLLGALFLYMGMNKALHPVEFLKVLRQYDMIQFHLPLNLIAAALPWFETFCGLLLLTGVAVRGTALMLVVMLVPFTTMVAKLALAIHAGGDMPFCAIKFDCGCGAGVVFICSKLVENTLLILLATVLVFSRNASLCLRHSLTKDGWGIRESF
jgi:uncharacterized membrane protein YphA (DoxX/SURF4 family)